MTVVAGRVHLSGPARPRRRRTALRRFVAWHPEWWVYVVAAAAWIALLLSSAGMQHVSTAAERGGASWLDDWTHWLLMVLAMMLPVAAPRVRLVAQRSIRSRQQRAAGFFVMGYVALWAGVGAVLVGTVLLTGLDHDSGDLLVVSLLLAAAWQVSVPRRRLVRRCASLKLGAPAGVAGDIDCARVGARSAARCLAESWPAMLAMALSHSFLLMAGLSVVLLTERARGANPARRAGRALEGWVLAAFSLVALATALG